MIHEGKMKGLLDFMSTPGGQGLLSAVVGGMAGARKGQPWNSVGRAGMAGLMGYQAATENQSNAELKKMQMDEEKKKIAREDAAQADWANITNPTDNSTELTSPFEQKYGKDAMMLARIGSNRPDLQNKMLEGMLPKVGEPYTLSKGQQRRDDNNVLVAESQGDGSDVFGNVSPGDFTPSSLEKFKVSGNYGDLVRQYAPQSQSSSAPYSTIVQTPDGLFSFDVRTKEFSPVTKADGTQAVGSTSSPQLQGDIAGARVTGEARAKRAFNMTGLGASVREARDLLSGISTDKYGVVTDAPKPTGSFIGAAVDFLGRVTGQNPEGSLEAQQLKAVAGALTAKMPRMEGPQSDHDVIMYKEAAAEVGNNTVPVQRRLAALDTVETLWAKYEDSGAPNQASPAAALSSVFDKADAILGGQ